MAAECNESSCSSGILTPATSASEPVCLSEVKDQDSETYLGEDDLIFGRELMRKAGDRPPDGEGESHSTVTSLPRKEVIDDMSGE